MVCRVILLYVSVLSKLENTPTDSEMLEMESNELIPIIT